MNINLYQAEKEHEEYERRIQAHLIEQAIRQARAERTQALVHWGSRLCDNFVTLLSLAASLLRRCRLLWLYYRTVMTQPRATN